MIEITVGDLLAAGVRPYYLVDYRDGTYYVTQTLDVMGVGENGLLQILKQGLDHQEAVKAKFAYEGKFKFWHGVSKRARMVKDYAERNPAKVVRTYLDVSKVVPVAAHFVPRVGDVYHTVDWREGYITIVPSRVTHVQFFPDSNKLDARYPGFFTVDVLTEDHDKYTAYSHEAIQEMTGADRRLCHTLEVAHGVARDRANAVINDMQQIIKSLGEEQ